jgi:MFS family permease
MKKRDNKKTVNIEDLKEKSREYSIKDGFFSTIKDSIVNNYIVPFAIAINSSDSLIAMFSSIPGLLGPITEWYSSTLIEKNKRKNIVLKTVFFEILTWIPLIIIALLYYFGIIVNLLPLMLLLFFSLYVICANAGAPAWFSWVGDIIDEEHRGRWFAKRNLIFGAVSLTCTISAAIFLDFLKKNNWTVFGFITLFIIAIISRIISRYFLSKQYEPEFKIEKGYYFSFTSFIKKAPFNNFGRFSIFRALVNWATMVASPFFVVYMLRDLKFSYLTLMIVVISQTLFTMLIIRFWGRFSDKYGNYEILKITSILIAFIPALWLLSSSPIYLVLVPQLISGIAWGGFNLAASNYVFDCVSPQRRSLALSYYDLLNGFAVFIGAGIGAILVSNLTINFMNHILFIFLVSGILRLLVALIMIPKIKEVKQKKKFEFKYLFRYQFFRHHLYFDNNHAFHWAK